MWPCRIVPVSPISSRTHIYTHTVFCSHDEWGQLMSPPTIKKCALASLASVFCLATSPDTIERVLASLNVLAGNETLKNHCVNKKHCYEKQLLPVDSGGSLLQTDMLLASLL